jgi:molecular chaperone GrpE
MAESRQEETSENPETTTGASLVEEVRPETERVSELEARLRTVSAAFREKQDEIGLIKDRLTRQAAVQEEIRRGEVVMALFEPVENLHRSLEVVKGHAAEGGLRMVYQQFMDALRKLGLEEVSGVGTRFDPAVHEAIATQPVTDPAQENVVMGVFSTGYRIGTRLVRPARVVIGSYVEGVGEA